MVPMDPASLSALLEHLAPVVAIIMTFGLPIGIVWTVKHHKYRMRELDIEALRLPANDRVRQLEARLAAVEQALGLAQRSPSADAQYHPLPDAQRGSLQGRAALLEGPPGKASDEENADPPRLRQR